MKRISEQQMLNQLYDLIIDRKSFLISNNCTTDSFQRDIIALGQIIHDYKLLKNFVFKYIEEKGENLNIWINENVYLHKVDILNCWKDDYGDMVCNALLYRNKKKVANIMVRLSENEIEDYVQKNNILKKLNENFINTVFKNFVYENFDVYESLPRITRCTNLLREIYDVVCESDSGMCYVTVDDWKNDYAEKYSTKDLDVLREEIKKYDLEDVLTLSEYGYKIVGYSDLGTKFNDDRNISKIIEYER